MTKFQPATPYSDSIKRPNCLECGVAMWLARIDPDLPDHDKRTFECPGWAELEREQWRHVWPSIEDYRYDLSTLEVVTSPDRLMAMGAVIFRSTGLHPDGTKFVRNGRSPAQPQRSREVQVGRFSWRPLPPAAISRPATVRRIGPQTLRLNR